MKPLNTANPRLKPRRPAAPGLKSGAAAPSAAPSADGAAVQGEVRLHIGDYFADREPTIIYTLLGSCVAACIFDPDRGIGGMNHILLPGEADISRANDQARFGVNAMELLINRVLAVGGRRYALKAKVFGGAHVLPNIDPANGVGRKIVHFVFDFLKLEKIPIISHDVGGFEARKLYFHTHTGQAFVKRIPSSYKDQIAQAETRYLRRIKKENAPAETVTLF